jgi:hypothetical protein
MPKSSFKFELAKVLDETDISCTSLPLYKEMMLKVDVDPISLVPILGYAAEKGEMSIFQEVYNHLFPQRHTNGFLRSCWASNPKKSSNWVDLLLVPMLAQGLKPESSVLVTVGASDVMVSLESGEVVLDPDSETARWIRYHGYRCVNICGNRAIASLNRQGGYSQSYFGEAFDLLSHSHFNNEISKIAGQKNIILHLDVQARLISVTDMLKNSILKWSSKISFVAINIMRGMCGQNDRIEDIESGIKELPEVRQAGFKFIGVKDARTRVNPTTYIYLSRKIA